MSDNDARRIRAARWAWQKGGNGPPSQTDLATLLRNMRATGEARSVMAREALAFVAGMEEAAKGTVPATVAREYLEAVKARTRHLLEGTQGSLTDRMLAAEAALDFALGPNGS